MRRFLWATVVLFQACAWAQDVGRSDEVARHDDGTVTVRFRSAGLHPGQLAQLLVPYASPKAFVKAVGDNVLVRDTPEKIREMEKIAAAFDVAPQPVELKFEVVWKNEEQPGMKTEGKLEPVPPRSRTVTLQAMLGREFRSTGGEEEPYAAEILEHPGGVNTTKRYRATGVTVQGTLSRRAGQRLDLQLHIEVTDVLPDKKFGTEVLEVAAALENGKSAKVATISLKGQRELEISVTATLK